MKLIIVGPPGTGKTTIKKVFFENSNPLKLLENSLNPTRGVSSSVYRFFDSKIGIFDLAGQENQNWFGKDRDVFENANLILCVFDIRNALKKIISFLKKIVSLKRNLINSNFKIIIFLHKIDLVSKKYSYQKLRVIRKFIRLRLLNDPHIEIYRTSITEEYFYNTFNVIMDILTGLLEIDVIPIPKGKFEQLKLELSILLKYESKIKYSKETLQNEFNLNEKKTDYHLHQLQKLGFLKTEEVKDTFYLTSRGELFKELLRKEIDKVENIKNDRKIKLFYTLTNLR